MQYGSMNIHCVTDIKVTQVSLSNGVTTQDIHVTTSDGDVFRLTCFLDEKYVKGQEQCPQ
jgi:hypothetical protein